MNKVFDVIIVGAGAAGFYAACELANYPLKIAIVEKSTKVLSKVKISGGGRCNLSHSVSYTSELIKNYPNGKNFLKKVFKQFSHQDTIKWFEDRGVKTKVEVDGRMFPISDDSQTIIDVLKKGSTSKGVDLINSFDLQEIKKEEYFILSPKKGESIRSKKILIATGGYPKDDQFSWIRSLGHSVNPPVPSLFTFNIPVKGMSGLAGLSVPNAKVSIVGEQLNYEGPLLITHWGISGPAVLKLSAWGARRLNELAYEFKVMVNWVGELSEAEIREQLQAYQEMHPKRSVKSNALFGIPKRLWEELMERASIADQHMYGDLGARSINRMLENIYRSELSAKGKTTFKEEFVTSGGVNLDELDPKTMQSKKQPGIYFAGEVIDVDGITGGFNFQAAWSTAYVAAKDIAAQLA